MTILLNTHGYTVDVPLGNMQGSVITKVNDVTIKDENFNGSGHTSNETNQPEKPTKLEVIWNITALDRDLTLEAEIYQEPGLTLLDSHTENVQSTGVYTRTAFFKWVDKKTTPTYLEELHKLDSIDVQSQYIPKP